MARRFSSEYLSYMNGPRWPARRRSYYASHERKCRASGARQAIRLHHLRLHHLRYSRLGNRQARDLMPLCGNRCNPLVTRLTRLGINRYVATYLVVWLTPRRTTGQEG